MSSGDKDFATGQESADFSKIIRVLLSTEKDAFM